LAGEVAEGRLATADINEALLASFLDTHDLPEPDLLIRTCNEQRLSNFLLWQLAYTELYFAEVAWPDFTKEELLKAVAAYNGRERKYGAIK
jgi:undecaprenyl diphosphate synthase